MALGPAVAHGQLVPSDFGQTANGFQDDFSGPVRNPSWVASPRFNDAYLQTNGILRVNVKGGDPNHLLFAAPGYNPTQQEVLARIRINEFGVGSFSRAGIAVGVDPDSSQGINLMFVDFEPGNIYSGGLSGRQLKMLNDVRSWGPPGFSLRWKTKAWYWLRLRQMEIAPGTSRIQSKAWPADGTVPEPGDWASSWNQETRSGFAGILAGSGNVANFDVDYLLIRADGLPEIKIGPRLLLLQEPEDQVVGPGQTITFGVAAAGSSERTYQWQIAKAGSNEFTDIADAAGANYSSSPIAATDNGVKYRCVISFAGNRVTTRSATLTVDSTPPTLVSARTIGNPHRITVVFSEPVARAAIGNFSVDNDVQVTRVAPGDRPYTLELTTSSLTVDKSYTLIVNGVRDSVGNEIIPDSRLAVDLSVEVPLDYGKIVNGFQDDFSSTERNPSWMASPDNSDGFAQANGVLKVTAKGSPLSHLLYRAGDCDPIEQEVLARIRITSFTSHPLARAGVGVGISPDTSEGVDLSFRAGDQAGVFGRQISLVDDRLAWGPPVLDLDWQNQTWYWLRLRQAKSHGGNQPKVYSKFWPADGTVPEPAEWQFDWQPDHRAGCAGILGPNPSAPSSFEVDYILIKSKGLPEITVSPEAFTLVPPKP
ncbi:MAG: Ig-like domain-containing protein [Candidatus Omnitrophica bacterium]|nr:Ig-like domain-containing protein [Candidatus Omnitrophota bacterium]